MKYFERFVSNTCGSSGNQLTFTMKAGEARVGRVFYKITVGGEYRYSLLFSNTVDSTFADGSLCHKNYVCDEWELLGARVGRCAQVPSGEAVKDLDGGMLAVSDWQPLTFDQSAKKTVMPGEFFASDPVPMRFEAGEYLCVEITFSGAELPYHEESILPMFVQTENGWQYDKKMPVPSMVGCDRAAECRLAFWGDSITQGCGTDVNAYEHWNAVLTQMLDEKYACWNIGLGYGRASDAASGGAWMFKALQNDLVVVCYGVNDIFRGMGEEHLKRDLACIVDTLKKAGIKVVVQTIPPFDYTGAHITQWNNVNEFIKTELSQRADLVFDVVPVLGKADQPHMARYNGHPDAEGCAIWAKALYAALKEADLVG